MKSSTMILLTATLLSFQIASTAFAADVTLTPGGATRRTVAPNDFVTIAYTAAGDFPDEKQFNVSVLADPALKLISPAAPISLRAGAPVKFTLTFQVSGKAVDAQVMPVAVELLSTPDGSAAARAETVLVAEMTVCAELRDLPAVVMAEGKRTADVRFSLHNCGGAREFIVEAAPGNDIEATSSPSPIFITSGETRRVSFTIYPKKDSADYFSTLKLRVLSKGSVAAVRTLRVSVTRPVVADQPSRYMYIPLKLSLRNALEQDHGSRTTLNISVPSFRDNDLTFRMNAQISGGGEAPIEARQVYDLGYGRSRVVYGGQRVSFSGIMEGGEFDEGLLVSRGAGVGALTFFNGSRGGARGNIFKWSRPISKRIDMDAGYFSSSGVAGREGGVSGANLKMKYAAGRSLSINSEFAMSRGFVRGRPVGSSGGGFQIAADFKKGKTKISASARGGSAGFAARDFLKGFNVRSQFNAGRGAFYFMSLSRRTAYQNATDELGDTSLAQKTSVSSSIGHTRKINRNFSATVSAYSSRTMKNGEASLAAGGDRKSMLLSLTRHSLSNTLTASFEAGTKQNFGASGRFSEFKLKNDFNMGKTRFTAGFIFANNASATGVGDRGGSYSLSANREITGLKTRFSLGFTKGSSGSLTGSGSENTFSFQSDTRFSKDFGLLIAYQVSNLRGVRTESLRAEGARMMNLNVRYKKLGAITGRVFEDRNRNAVFDAGDEPLEDVRIKVSGARTAYSDKAGSFEIVGLKPGTYTLALDSGTYPIGLGGNGATVVKIKASRVEMDFPLQKVMRISGHVRADRSDYFAKYSKLTADKLRVVLMKGDSVVVETFTDKDGDYYFENILPGFYDVLLDPEWIAKDSEIRGANKYTMNCGEPDACRNLDFTVAAKSKSIKKTFSK